jgi:toxin ParE1/3/4
MVVRPQARVDMLEIWHHIAPANLDAADRLFQDLHTAIRDLARMPGMGHMRSDVADPRMRFWTVKPYVIAYRYDGRRVIVERVVHGHRNFRRIFRRPPRG